MVFNSISHLLVQLFRSWKWVLEWNAMTFSNAMITVPLKLKCNNISLILPMIIIMSLFSIQKYWMKKEDKQISFINYIPLSTLHQMDYQHILKLKVLKRNILLMTQFYLGGIIVLMWMCFGRGWQLALMHQLHLLLQKVFIAIIMSLLTIITHSDIIKNSISFLG